jgi:hypothetical protein
VVLEPSPRAELHSRHWVCMALQHRDRHPERQRPDPDGVIVGARRYESVVNGHGEIGDVALMQSKNSLRVVKVHNKEGAF